MPQYEYKVVPAPAKGVKARGLKTPESRFANALQLLMNRLGADGWEYQRAETLPSQERSGLTSTVTTYRNMLVFRRLRDGDISEFNPVVLEIAEQADLSHETAEDNETAPEIQIEEDAERPAGQPGATKMLRDNGVEDLSDVAGMTHALKNRASQKKPAS